MNRFAPTLLAVALLVAACTPDDGGATTSVEGTDRDTTTTVAAATTTTAPPDGYGGTVRVGLQAEVPSVLNPLDPSAEGSGGIALGNAVWAMVYDIDPMTFEKVPDSVIGLPTQTAGAIEVNDDGSITVQYQVHPDARWSDGIPISGADLAFTAEAMRDEALAGNPVVPDVMASVSETDSLEKVAWITFAEPSLAFEDALRFILPSHAIGDADPAGDVTGWPSGGPFQADPNDPLRFERNDFYWKTDAAGNRLPYIDALEFIPIGEPAEAISASAVDVSEIGDPSFLVTSGTQLVVEAVPTPILEHLTFGFSEGRSVVNETSNNDVPDYRRAIAHSIDRVAILEASGVPWDPATPGVLIPVGASAWDRYPLNESLARQLLSTLEETPAAVLASTANASERPAIAAELTDAWDALDIDASEDLQDSVLFYQTALPDGVFDIGMWAWINDGSYGSVLGMLDYFSPTGEPGSFSAWGVDGPTANEASERFSEIADLARSVVDPAEFWDLIEEAEEILADQLPLIPLFHRTIHVVTASNRVDGVIPNGTSSQNTWNVEIWQVPGE